MTSVAWRRYTGPLTIALLCTALTAAGPDALRALRYDRAAVAAGQWWRLIGCALVHLNDWHLVLDVAGLLLLALLAPRAWTPSAWAARLAVTSAGMSALLWWCWPQVGTYVGLSGPLYGLAVIALLPAASAGDRLAAFALVVLVSGVGLELAFGSPAAEERLIGGHVVAESHFAGLLAGAAWRIVAQIERRVRRR